MKKYWDEAVCGLIYEDGYFFSFPWGSKLRRTRKWLCYEVSIVGLTFVLGVTTRKLTTYPLFLNYLTKHPFCESIKQSALIPSKLQTLDSCLNILIPSAIAINLFKKNSNPNFLIPVMLCFGCKSCFLTEKPKVGNGWVTN